MGVDIMIWRMRIGCFRASSLQLGKSLSNQWAILDNHGKGHSWRVVFFLALLLVLSGDVETNPGPTNRSTTSLSSVEDSENRHSSEATTTTMQVILPPVYTLADVMSSLSEMRTQSSTQYTNLNNQIVNLTSKIDSAITRINSLEQENARLKTVNDNLSQKVSRLEEQMKYVDNQARKNNIILYGLADSDRESRATCSSMVYEFLHDNFNISDNNYLAQVYRIGQFKVVLHPRPIMLTFKENDTKMQVLKKSSFLRGSRFALSEDYDSVVREKRKKLYDHFKNMGIEAKNIMLRYDTAFVNGNMYGIGDDGSVKCIK